MDRITFFSKDGRRESAKLEIIRALLSFDAREPDKTMGIWEEVAKKLYMNDELRSFENFQGVVKRGE